ncbi:MAG: pyruvate dehydrogenase (acetyl-transferring) E1 component subunit alpha [Bacillaceae bacterium]|nr:pyruvate dehydrogenase (acetyl-transferring) E1 component subunit alpha [Bacillaceae bacterium]
MEKLFPIEQVLSPEGELKKEIDSVISGEKAVAMYKWMVINRIFDRKSVTLQRQGRIGTYAPFEGQEAAQVGSALALQENDWLFPTYRDHAAMMTYGQSMTQVLLYWKGRIEGCVPPEDKHILPPYVPIATQIPHAAGAAWASRMKGEDAAALVYFGDGATSEGDFHEGLNFASVYDAPVVFFCQNNGYAISVPVTKQMKSKTIAQKALAYDIEGVRVDGNDVFAVYMATREALERARKGEGPTLIEAVTYRYGAHTTADDPRKYREQEKEEKLRREKYDPVDRLKRYLVAQGVWDDQKEAALIKEAEEKVQKAVQEMETFRPASVADMFEHIFAEKTWNIEQQQREAVSMEEKPEERELA